MVLLQGRTRKTRTVDTWTEWANLGGDSLRPQKLFLVLPLPPSINHQYATVNGRRVLASKGRQYKKGVAQHVFAILREAQHREPFLDNLQTHTISLSLRFFFKSALRRDLDGGLKIAQDAICQAIGLNDNRITEIHLIKDLDSCRPRMECTLSVSHPTKKPQKPPQRVTPVTRT